MASTGNGFNTDSISNDGRLELLQHSNSATDSTFSTNITRDDSTETLLGGASTTSLHAVFNLDTGKVLDTVKETREILNDKSKKSANVNKAKPPRKPKKKISASWTTEWSEDAFEKKASKSKGN